MTPFAIIARLNAARIHHTITSIRDDAIMIDAAVPGERWEIEVFEDGHVEIERYTSAGEIAGEAALVELFARFSDTQ
ncbi:hypothetical protein ASE95_05530 [Sphingomonas sp. Leaf231]|uniref:hypothetical protein n=1 Tax=Sphingomonas TaxID=13687 RepID=UPI0003B42B0C|nr:MULTISPECIES: hypothetical protein [Sphingomonas]KQN94297.1 hypothetical protein ASE95_05530 [Sphingomonas sp. Leaf231]